jgi:hypothetical protein
MPQARRTIAFVLAVVALGWAVTAEAARTHRRRRHTRRARPGVSAPLATAAPAQPAPMPAPTKTKTRTRTKTKTKTRTATAPATATTTAPANPKAARWIANPSLGRVQFLTDRRAYLDRGAADGLSLRQSLAVARAGRPIGACTIESVGDHEATCVGARLRVGDTFRAGRHVVRRATGTPLPELAPVVDEPTLRKRAAAIADAGIEKVDFNGKHAFRGRSSATVSSGFGAWLSQGDPQGGGYAQERIDGAIRGVEIGPTGFRFDGAFSAVRWNQPLAVERFRAGTPTQFYLWEAEASRRQQDAGTTVAVGRLWPFHTPGLTLLDGVQLGRQNESQTAEGGLYGGLIPSAASLAPSFDIWAAGLYGALHQVGAKASWIRLARQEARVGVWRGAGTSVISELEALAQAWIGPVTAGGGGRLRWNSDLDRGRPVVERAYLDLGVQPSTDTRAGLHVRYVGATLLPDAPLRAETPLLGGQLHALADAQLALSPRLALAASAGAHREGDSGLHQIHGGAEVRFPRLFGDAGGLWVGGEVEQGWIQGENLYVQWVGRYANRLQIFARLSANGTRFETPATVSNLHELGGTLNLDGVLTSWLRMRAWSLVRVPILVQGEIASQASFGTVLGLSLVGAI